MSREFLFLVEESAYKTPATAVVWPTSSATAFYIRMDGSNAFTMRPRPVIVPVPYGGGYATDAFRVADKLECKGHLTTKLYAGPVSQFLLSWAAMPINTGQTSPWTTTEIATDLASVSIYHGIACSDGTIKRRVYLGCKVDSWELEISESGTIATMSLQITGSTPQGNQFDSSSDPTSGTFPVPTDSQMPTTGTTGPYVFAHASGGLLIGSARTQFDAVKIKSTNVLAKRFWASRFLGMARLVGRHDPGSHQLLHAHAR